MSNYRQTEITKDQAVQHIAKMLPAFKYAPDSAQGANQIAFKGQGVRLWFNTLDGDKWYLEALTEAVIRRYRTFYREALKLTKTGSGNHYDLDYDKTIRNIRLIDIGDNVKMATGAFWDCNGFIQSIDYETGLINIDVMVFGRYLKQEAKLGDFWLIEGGE